MTWIPVEQRTSKSLYWTPNHERRLRTLDEANRLADRVWKELGLGARPRLEMGRNARTKGGSWHLRIGVASGCVGLRTSEKIIINPSGLNVGTVLHELAHALHWRRAGQDARTMRAQGMHGAHWRRCEMELERLEAQTLVS